MDRGEVLSMIEVYQGYATGPADVLNGIYDRFPEGGSDAKAMRWLGFCQGVLHEREVFTLDELKAHSQNRRVPPCPPPEQRLETVRGILQYLDNRGGLGLDVHRELKVALKVLDNVDASLKSLRSVADAVCGSTLMGSIEIEEKTEVDLHGVLVSLDDGKTYQPVIDNVRLIYPIEEELPGEDCNGELHINLTHEGIIMDVWTNEGEPGEDRNLATRSQTLDEIVAELMEDDS